MVHKQHIPRKHFRAVHDLLALYELGPVRVQSFDSSSAQRTLSSIEPQRQIIGVYDEVGLHRL